MVDFQKMIKMTVIHPENEKKKFCWNIVYVWSTFNLESRVDINCLRVLSTSEGIKKCRISENKVFTKRCDK